MMICLAMDELEISEIGNGISPSSTCSTWTSVSQVPFPFYFVFILPVKTLHAHPSKRTGSSGFRNAERPSCIASRHLGVRIIDETCLSNLCELRFGSEEPTGTRNHRVFPIGCGVHLLFGVLRTKSTPYSSKKHHRTPEIVVNGEHKSTSDGSNALLRRSMILPSWK